MQLERPVASPSPGHVTTALTPTEAAAAAHFATVVLREVERHASSPKPDWVDVAHVTERTFSVPYFYGNAQRHFDASPLHRVEQNDSTMIAAVNAGLAGTGIRVTRGFMTPACELGHGAIVDVYALQVAVNSFAFEHRSF